MPALASSARFDTVAGLVLAELGRVPREGDTVRVQNLTLTVERMDGRRIDRILLTRELPGEPADSALAVDHEDGV
jgi:CBS domain containing-hemolysin-like protein